MIYTELVRLLPWKIFQKDIKFEHYRQVGIHTPLRSAAEAALLAVTDRGSKEDAFGLLLWSGFSAECIYRALTSSLSHLFVIPTAQVCSLVAQTFHSSSV